MECNNCKFYREVNREGGTCHLNPPTLKPGKLGAKPSEWANPAVYKDNTCSNFTKRQGQSNAKNQKASTAKSS